MKLAFGDHDFTVKIWDVSKSEEVHQFVVGKARDIAYSPEGDLLAVASGRHVKIRDAITGRLTVSETLAQGQLDGAGSTVDGLLAQRPRPHLLFAL